MYNILVCDDDKEIVEAIEIYLSQEGYHVLKAYDGAEALKMLESQEVHLLVLEDVYKRQAGAHGQGELEMRPARVWPAMRGFVFAATNTHLPRIMREKGNCFRREM